MKQKSRFQTARRFLIFWTLFIGIGAVAGALAINFCSMQCRKGQYKVIYTNTGGEQS